MRILNLSVHDMAGSAYCLAHAINKHTKHHAINLRSSVNYVNYPSIAEMRNYDMPTCKQMMMKADVILFHSAIRPFFDAFEIERQSPELKKKKKIVYFHGTELRYYGKEFIAEADEFLGDYQIVVSSPDLMFYAPKGSKWLPVARSFKEIWQKYGLNRRDRAALRSFTESRRQIVLCHAPSDEAKKGSDKIYAAITKIIKTRRDVTYQMIRNQPWDSCLRMMSQVDMYFDQAPPFLCSYGTVSVEASVFRIPVFTQLTQQVADVMKRETGFDNPFVSFGSPDDLVAKIYVLCEDKEKRRVYGKLVHDYCKAVHDEQPVAERCMRIIEDMPC